MTNSRQLLLNGHGPAGGTCVLYVMGRDQRVRDNHALLAAQASAVGSKLPLVVAFNVLPSTGERRREHYEFMFAGLKGVEKDLRKLNVPFVLRRGKSSQEIPKLIKELSPKEVFFDFSPLRGPRTVQKQIAATAACRCSVIDTHNIIPVWVTSDKEEFAAHTIRRKVHKQLTDWLAEPKKLKPHPHKLGKQVRSVEWKTVEQDAAKQPSNGIELDFRPGEKAAADALKHFLKHRLDTYAQLRNASEQDGQSNLSPYLHFGQLASLRIVLEVLDTVSETPLLFEQAKLASPASTPTRMDGVNALLEELIVRKELSDNFCFYNEHYDSFQSGRDWAKQSLDAHRKDKREYVYDFDEWEQAKTHDRAWNAAQVQMVRSGKMHGYMRMYWAKKILEWSKTPEEAVETAVRLNDRYEIDGGDPNGYVGVMWSIVGVHDRPWVERPVFGKVRYMNSAGLRRKFDLQTYMDTWTQ